MLSIPEQPGPPANLWQERKM